MLTDTCGSGGVSYNLGLSPWTKENTIESKSPICLLTIVVAVTSLKIVSPEMVAVPEMILSSEGTTRM